MNKTLKWITVTVAAAVATGIALVAAAVMLLDVKELKSRLEAQVAAATGRPFTIGQDFTVSVFPWIEVRLHDLKLGNPDGFAQPDFVSVDSFAIRLKLLPLLRKQIQVRSFAVRNPRVVLEKRADGRGNWNPGPAPPQPRRAGPAASSPAEAGTGENDVLSGLAVRELKITGGTVLWIDSAAASRTTVEDIELSLANLSLDRPIGVDLAARIDGYPLTVQGTVGPVGRPAGAAPVTFDLAVSLLGALRAAARGSVKNVRDDPEATLQLSIPAVSLRDVAGRASPDLLPAMRDPKALTRFSFKADIAAGSRHLALRNGRAELDGSAITLALAVRDFDAPDLRLDIAADALDVDRYLPPEQVSAGAAPARPAGESSAAGAAPVPADYGPLRRMALDASVTVGRLTAGGVRADNLSLKLAGSQGVVRLDSCTADLYGGSFDLGGTADVRQDRPRTAFQATMKNVAAGPLLQAVAGTDVIEGLLQADIRIAAAGSAAEQVKRSLSGEGRILISRGAVVGIDLHDMVRNIESAFTPGGGAGKPKTTFDELSVPFTMAGGVFRTTEARLVSPSLRVDAAGTADLAGERLNFTVTPAFVASRSGDRHGKHSAGIAVPVVVAGTFDHPTFRPDMGAMARQEIDKKLDKVFEKNEKLQPLEDTARGLLKGLLGSPK